MLYLKRNLIFKYAQGVRFRDGEKIKRTHLADRMDAIVCRFGK